MHGAGSVQGCLNGENDHPVGSRRRHVLWELFGART